MTSEAKYYTGVGSRKTPPDILKLMEDVGDIMCEKGYTLRSGGADGADSAFERGCDFAWKKTRLKNHTSSLGKKEIFLPWKEFNKNKSPLWLKKDESEAILITESVCSHFNKLSQGAQKLHTRNVYQVLGQDLKTPSRVVICWTENGEVKGGTATAIKLAQKYNIPVFNLGIQQELREVKIRLGL